MKKIIARVFIILVALLISIYCGWGAWYVWSSSPNGACIVAANIAVTLLIVVLGILMWGICIEIYRYPDKLLK